LALLGDVVKNLGPRLMACWPARWGTTVDLISHSQARLGSAQSFVDAEDIDDEADAEELGDTNNHGLHHRSPARFANSG